MPHTLASRTASLIFATHLEHFDRDVIEASHTVPVMVDFRGHWCPLRRALAPVLKRVIADHFGKLKTVSYTHLDVYKRQLPWCPHRHRRRC